MRISDWSSDVCSSDLIVFGRQFGHLPQRALAVPVPDQIVGQQHRERLISDDRPCAQHRMAQAQGLGLGDKNRTPMLGQYITEKSEERRGGEECGSTSK